MREDYDIRRDLKWCKTQHLISKVLSIIGLICTIILSTLFYTFVFNKGNVFDIILSSGVILFFVILSLYNLYRYKDLSKSKKSLDDSLVAEVIDNTTSFLCLSVILKLKRILE